MSQFLYISPGVLDDYSRSTHVDAIRFTEMYRGLRQVGLDVARLDLFRYREHSAEALSAVEKADALFIHHESAIRTLANLFEPAILRRLLSERRAYFQCDCLDWKWLGLNPDDYLPMFDLIAVANVFDAATREYPLVPLAIFNRLPIYNSESDVALYLGRYQPWFNRRMLTLADELQAMSLRLRILTYPDQRGNIDGELQSRSYVEISDAVPYLQIGDTVPHARLGIAFRNGPHPNGKVWDYLSLGLPVVFETGISEAEFLRQGRTGIEWPVMPPQTLTSSVSSYGMPDFRLLQESNSWSARARQWANLLRAYE